ncbi:PilZ domain-containing protein [Paenibacillus agricola]|uniref:PilZ domain-containing protein n=1 Tax=Paenibacillus agricola TaxID=2716264 RepID=A0ABX0JBN7_9BACL|nr:PilZ domain-containing protein [Paenibacillus agricola]NHN31599.1 PilZ domain-containing protein [Paenibacillus agricola]
MTSYNKREYFRLSLQIPLSAELKIIGINEVSVETKYAQIVVVDISAGGLRIHAKLDLPLHIDLLLEFKFSLFDKQMKILGTITRKSMYSPELYEYGIRFSLDDHTHSLLIGKLNLLHIRLKQTKVVSSCSFCSEEELVKFYSNP